MKASLSLPCSFSAVVLVSTPLRLSLPPSLFSTIISSLYPRTPASCLIPHGPEPFSAQTSHSSRNGNQTPHFNAKSPSTIR